MGTSLVACLALCLVAQQTRTETWPDGSRRAEYEVEVRDGHEVRSGPYRSWHENGRLASEGVFAADRESGRWTFYHPNGERAAEGGFARGERNGMWETFHESGERAARGRYDKGRRTGAWTFTNPDGSEDELASGVWEFRAIRAPDGRMALSGYLVDGERHGRWESTWPDLTTQLAGEYRRGRRHGPWLFRHRRGGLSRVLSGTWQDGVRAGPAEIPPEELGDLARAAEPAPSPWGAAPHRAEIEADLERWLALDDRQATWSLQAAASRTGPPGAWLLHPAEAWPVVLARLRAADPATAEGLAAIRRLDLIALRPLCGGRGLTEAPPADAVEARELVLAWLSAWEALRADGWLWAVELPHPVEGETRLELPFLAAVDEHVPPSLYAARTGPLPRGTSQAALDSALAWLVAMQRPDGGWSSYELPDGDVTRPSGGQPGYDVGVSALALLALLGDGHTLEDGEHAHAVGRGVAWLLAQGKAPDGRMYTVYEDPDQPGSFYVRHEWLYEHVAATLVLCEALAHTPSRALRHAAQRAVDVVLLARNPYSGWRYELPPIGENDTSITAWAVTALCAARAVGLEGDLEAALDGAMSLLDEMTDLGSGRVGYNKAGSLSSRTQENADYPRELGEAMTATALACRLLAGTPPAAEIVAKQVALLHARPPTWAPEDLAVDEYYFAQGALALALCGELKPWLGGFREVAKAQTGNLDDRGSWDPVGAWAYAGGRVFSTAMLALMLEAPKRYVLADAEDGGRR